jgi:carboxypeptidase T
VGGNSGLWKLLFAVTSALALFILILNVLGQSSDEYHTYDSLTHELRLMVSSHSDVSVMVSLGKSWEGRQIWAVNVAESPGPSSTKPSVLFLGSIHGNEKIALEVVLAFLEYVLEAQDDDDELASLVREADLWFVPLVNPDGYEHNTRKNARDNDLDGAYGPGDGVDLNRNFDHDWGTACCSPRPMDNVYGGPYPFSEPESQAIRDLALGQDFEIVVSFHSYGEVILYPWKHSFQVSEAEEVLHSIAVEMASENGYDVGQGSHPEISHLSSGDLCDWMHQLNGCLPFTVELGRTFSPSRIGPVVEENMELCRTAVRFASPDG